MSEDDDYIFSLLLLGVSSEGWFYAAFKLSFHEYSQETRASWVRNKGLYYNTANSISIRVFVQVPWADAGGLDACLHTPGLHYRRGRLKFGKQVLQLAGSTPALCPKEGCYVFPQGFSQQRWPCEVAPVERWHTRKHAQHLKRAM